MIAENEKITDARKDDIRRRVAEYIEKHDDVSQQTIARQCHVSKGTVSDVLRGKYGARSGRGGCDDTEYLRRMNNWMELDARRRNIVQNREFVDTSVAKEIIAVAEIVSETCKMGVIFGPAQIGKSFTLSSIAGSDRMGNPVLFRIDESCRTPKSLCRLICDRFKLPIGGTFDALCRRVIKQIEGTKRMLMFDEAERLTYTSLEFVRDLHDQTGCPILLTGKPRIYQKLGFRDMGDYVEVTDQLASRIVIRRDLTQRTRAGGPTDPEPLFTKEDVRKLIKVANLEIKVSRDGVDWLHERACLVGFGGLGKCVIHLYLAYKMAVALGVDEITAAHFDAVEMTTLGYEDVDRADDLIAQRSKMEIRRIG